MLPRPKQSDLDASRGFLFTGRSRHLLLADKVAGESGPLSSNTMKSCSLCPEQPYKDGLCRGHYQSARLEAATEEHLKRADSERVPVKSERVWP